MATVWGRCERITALERLYAGAVPACRCLLAYQAGEPVPELSGTCPVCGLPRTGENVLIEEIIVAGREEAEACLRAMNREIGT